MSTKSGLKAESMMNQKNLAAFTKQRASLKVVGGPKHKLPSHMSQSSTHKSYFSNNSRSNRPRQDGADVQSSNSQVRFRKSVNAAEMHKKRIFDAVNQLNEEELERVSEMLKVSEALN